jgi:hypothetical protein
MVTSFQKWLRSRTSRAAVLPVVLALSVMFGATPALARAQRTVLDGTEHKYFGIPEHTWTAGPWEIHANQTLLGDFDFGALKGTLVWVANDQIDFSTGNGHVWGKVSYTDTASGVICAGTVEGKITAFLLTAKIVAPCSDGSQMMGTLQDTSNNGVEIFSTFHGELLSP